MVWHWRGAGQRKFPQAGAGAVLFTQDVRLKERHGLSSKAIGGSKSGAFQEFLSRLLLGVFLTCLRTAKLEKMQVACGYSAERVSGCAYQCGAEQAVHLSGRSHARMP